jgi:Uma2 family endonuclease
MTLEEWADLPEDDEGELVDGLLAEEEVPDFLHELVVAWFIRVLGNWAAPRGGLVGGSEAKLAIADGRGRKPDAVVYFHGRRPPARGIIRIPPDIALEVVSPRPRDGRRDRVEKLADYAAFGIRRYWLLDIELRTLEILELGADGRYAHAVSATVGTLSSLPGCEGLSIDLDELWRAVEELAQGDPPA